MGGRLGRLALYALAVAGLDQLIKALVVAYLPAGGLTLLPGFVDLVLVHNKGAAFGFLAGLAHGRWLLAGVGVVAVAVMLWLARGPMGANPAALFCLGLVGGGTLGNLVDRLRVGRVVDFVYLHWHDLYWPAFNLADSCITIGGIWLAWLLLRGKA
ncbi:MAG: signal peptidase II [Deltaproteobacteria bacterium]|nr:signal peptidase II [Deltaproteobacteria bacterium]